jgi:hypothetical protein
MFGIRKALKRLFSVEAMTTAVERKIASDMARDPSHPRNAVGGQLIAAVRSVREQAVARRELEDLIPAYNRHAIETKAKMDFFASQTPEWQVAHADERERIQWEINALNRAAERITALAEIAGTDLTSVTIHNS